MVLYPSADALATMTAFSDGDSSVLMPSLTSVMGTREYVECSDHGVCNRDTGSCECFSGYGTSDGRGALGSRGDCGYQYSVNVTVDVNGTAVETGCPYVMNSIYNESKVFCSGHGNCSFFYGTCECDEGYGK